MSAFFVFALSCFASGFASRLVDPLVLPIAAHFAIAPAASAMLNVAFAIPYAVAQPFLGPIGDRFGKDRCIQICTVGMALAITASTLAPTFGFLVATRIGAGLFSAGLTPLVLAALGDRYGLEDRQVMIGRMLFAIIMGQMLGSAVSGLMNDLFGWRSPLILAAGIGLTAAAIATLFFKAAPAATAAARALQPSIRSVYATIFGNPKTGWLYGAVAFEGALFFGCFPFIGQLLVEHTGASLADAGRETGVVLGAAGLGGLAYTLSVRVLMNRLGASRMSVVGSIITAVCFVALSVSTDWRLCAIFMGIAGMSFFMMHSSMQTQATELVPTARASAVALFACGFFAGQGVGPLWFGPVSRALGFHAALIAAAVGFVALGQVVVRKVVQP